VVFGGEEKRIGARPPWNNLLAWEGDVAVAHRKRPRPGHPGWGQVQDPRLHRTSGLDVRIVARREQRDRGAQGPAGQGDRFPPGTPAATISLDLLAPGETGFDQSEIRLADLSPIQSREALIAGTVDAVAPGIRTRRSCPPPWEDGRSYSRRVPLHPGVLRGGAPGYSLPGTSGPGQGDPRGTAFRPRTCSGGRRRNPFPPSPGWPGRCRAGGEDPAAHEFDVMLDQSLLVVLENECRWMALTTGATPGLTIPTLPLPPPAWPPRGQPPEGPGSSGATFGVRREDPDFAQDVVHHLRPCSSGAGGRNRPVDPPAPGGGRFRAVPGWTSRRTRLNGSC